MITSLDLVTSDLGFCLGVLVCLRGCFSLSETILIIGRREGRHASGVRMAFMLASFLLFGCPHSVATNRLSNTTKEDVLKTAGRDALY